jgi:hypothetical protein
MHGDGDNSHRHRSAVGAVEQCDAAPFASEHRHRRRFGAIGNCEHCFAEPLVVVVTDAANAPVAGATVEFSVPQNGASASLTGGNNDGPFQLCCDWR